MVAGTPQGSALAVDDGQIGELSERITHLRELIIVMVDLNRDTRRQSELLFRLLREFRAGKLARSAAPDVPQIRASHPGAFGVQLDA